MTTTLPFSHDAFLDVFGAYNAALWPAAAALWLATAWLAIGWIRRGTMNLRWLYGLLAVHWAWSGIAYHWFFFRGINPAASSFAAIFVAQALLFAWLAMVSGSTARAQAGIRHLEGNALVAYGLAYPALGLAFGLDFPRLPLFAVPCPTALVTAGWLIALHGAPRFIKIVPALWALVGVSAAVQLGIRADFALGVAALLLAIDMLLPSAHVAPTHTGSATSHG